MVLMLAAKRGMVPLLELAPVLDQLARPVEPHHNTSRRPKDRSARCQTQGAVLPHVLTDGS
jgi:hypothetical protein